MATLKLSTHWKLKYHASMQECQKVTVLWFPKGIRSDRKIL